jgi:hypothetical protein
MLRKHAAPRSLSPVRRFCYHLDIFEMLSWDLPLNLDHPETRCPTETRCPAEPGIRLWVSAHSVGPERDQESDHHPGLPIGFEPAEHELGPKDKWKSYAHLDHPQATT